MMKKVSIAAIPLILFFTLGTQAQVLLKFNDTAIRYDLIKPSHTFSKVTSFDSLGRQNYGICK